MTRRGTAPRILGMRGSMQAFATNGDAIKRPNQPRNVHSMCVWAKPALNADGTPKTGLVKANPAR